MIANRKLRVWIYFTAAATGTGLVLYFATSLRGDALGGFFGPLMLTIMGGWIAVCLRIMAAIVSFLDRNTSSWPKWLRDLFGISYWARIPNENGSENKNDKN